MTLKNNNVELRGSLTQKATATRIDNDTNIVANGPVAFWVDPNIGFCTSLACEITEEFYPEFLRKFTGNLSNQELDFATRDFASVAQHIPGLPTIARKQVVQYA